MPLHLDLVTTTHPRISRGERKASRLLLLFEDLVKVPIFRCQRCGECILSSTAFICSQNCPKRLRNGPCGGTGVDGTCEVYPDRKCVWVRIYNRSRLLRRVSLLYHVNRIHNWNLERTSAWLNVLKGRTRGTTLLVRNDRQRIKELLSDDSARKA